MGPHDLLFRSVFSEPEHAAALLRFVLPPELEREADWSSLQALSVSIIDDELKQYFADILFSVELGGQRSLVHVLVEHQSWSHSRMPLRILRFMLAAWEQYADQHPAGEKLPPIVAVVVHHDAESWRRATRLSDLLTCDDAVLKRLERYVPDFSFILEDLSPGREHELHRWALTALGKVALFCLMRSRSSKDLLRELRDTLWPTLLMVVGAPHGVAAIGRLLRYISQTTDTPMAELGKFAKQLGPGAEAEAMTLAERLEQNGIEKGIERGIEKGRHLGSAETLLVLLEARFHPLDDAVRQRILAASNDQIKQWTVRALAATTIDELFA